MAERDIATPGAILATRLSPAAPAGHRPAWRPRRSWSRARRSCCPPGDPQPRRPGRRRRAPGDRRLRLARGQAAPRRLAAGRRREPRQRQRRPLRPGARLPPLLARHGAAPAERSALWAERGAGGPVGAPGGAFLAPPRYTGYMPEKPDVRELRGTGGIRPDYDYKALRIESA